ncbi:DNA endonuclease SmrA [Pontibacterium sp.]|jgi:DNA-nicking Smr family endonuclease|uniref:DNA endonuclease SmrA n=1 Tax=Pontibacterium sp. TaxID=2036026 RepID=UPI0035643CE5
MSSDDLDFMDMMMGEGVTPAKQSDKADLIGHQDKRGDAGLKERRHAAEGDVHESLSTQQVVLLHPFDPLEWKRDGVQDGVYRNVRLGKYQSDARLDLHKKSPTQALDELLGFITECSGFGIRSVVVSHGRGSHEDAPGNVMRSYLNQWLPLIPEVMAFHSAQKQHGGLGATYILLRKNETQRRDNWEKHQKR